MINHPALVQEIASHVDGSKPLTKERKAVVLAVLRDPSESAAVTAAMKAAWPGLKTALQTLLDNAQAGAVETKRLSANAAFAIEYNKSAARRQLETTIANAGRASRKK